MAHLNAPEIEKIEQLVRLAVAPNIQTCAAEPKNFYYLTKPSGEVELVQAQPPEHGEFLDTPTALLKFIQENKPENGGAAVFLDESGLEFVFDFASRRDKAVCVFSQTEPFLWLHDSANVLWTQADFIRALRIIFRGCLGESGLLRLARDLKFSSGVEAAASIQHGRESLGRQIDTKVSGASELPEDVILLVQLWENWPSKRQIHCALEVFPQDQRFRLRPYPGELRNAIDLELQAIGDLFEEARAADETMPPLFYGRSQA